MGDYKISENEARIQRHRLAIGYSQSLYKLRSIIMGHENSKLQEKLRYKD